VQGEVDGKQGAHSPANEMKLCCTIPSALLLRLDRLHSCPVFHARFSAHSTRSCPQALLE
jgi:hypothetical protein